jgi:hypothetical protein
VQIAAVSLDWMAPGVSAWFGIGTSGGTPAARAALLAGVWGAELAGCGGALLLAAVAGAELAPGKGACVDGAPVGSNTDDVPLLQPDSSPAARAAPVPNVSASILAVVIVLPLSQLVTRLVDHSHPTSAELFFRLVPGHLHPRCRTASQLGQEPVDAPAWIFSQGFPPVGAFALAESGTRPIRSSANVAPIYVDEIYIDYAHIRHDP